MRVNCCLPNRWVCCLLCAVTASQSFLRAEDSEKTSPAVLPPPAARKVDFAQDVKPILRQHCWDCHGAESQEAGLRLDIGEFALEGGDTGPAILSGKSETSLLIEYVAGVNPDVIMPPEGDRLTAEQVGILRAWIDQGAVWPAADDAPRDPITHWAYQPVVRPELPRVQNSAWAQNAIDYFVLARLEAAGIQPSPEADRYTLIRRLSLDLLGLPPSVEEVDAYMEDAAHGAYGRLVDRLLASPHFGERWGRHWLDKARYADSDGYEKDRPRPDAWRYRDWVLAAVNADMPYDEFTVLQQAGDLLPPTDDPYESAMRHLATAFHRQTLTNTEGGTDQEEFRVAAVFDRVETTGSVWLGLTVGCARCHTHKFDRISQREYYQLFAFLNNGDEINDVPVPRSERLADELQRLEQRWQDERERIRGDFDAWLAELQRQYDSATARPLAFHDLRDVKVTSQGKLKFEVQPDGSFLVTGPNPEKADYTIEARVDVDAVTGFRIDTLADAALPGRGPGRVAHGNFVLNEVVAAYAAAEGSGAAQPIQFVAAQADFSQDTFSPEAVFDGSLAMKNGWAIAPRMAKDHHLIVVTERPIPESASKKFTITLKQTYGSQHTIGRFRIRAVTGQLPGAGIPGEIAAVLETKASARTSAQRDALFDHFVKTDSRTARLQKQIDAFRKQAEIPVRLIRERTAEVRTTHVLRRGDFLQPGPAVEPDTLEVLPPITSTDGSPDRLDFARWLVSPDNPLTPRVTVNQIWSHLFGEALVRTMYDFGVRGEPPTHPALLDWLAAEFMRQGWSRKQLIREIVMSSTYRQSSVHRPELEDADPLNKLLHRQNRFRVDAEIVRDQSLAVSGLLTPKLGGPSVFPYMPADVAALSYANNFKWTTSTGGDQYRRGMYTFFKRTAPHPNLMTFDCPDANTTCVERSRSNTPLQALTTLNNDVFVEAAQALAARVLKNGPASPDDRLTRAFRLCVARQPTSDELRGFEQLLSECRQWYAAHGSEPSGMKDTTQAAAAAGPDRVDNIAVEDQAAWVATVRILLNLDEYLTRE